MRLWEKRGLKAAKSQKQSNMISSSSIAYHGYSPKTYCFYQSKFSLAQWVGGQLRMLKVPGSIPGQSINPFCRCPHFLRESGDRNWLWELAAGFGFIVISVCYVMNADQQLLYGCTFSYGESLLQLVPET